MKSLLIGLVATGILFQVDDKEKPEGKSTKNKTDATAVIDPKEAEKLDKLVAKIVSNGKLIADQEKLRAPKRMQKKMPVWLPPPLNIRAESLSTGSVGFVDDFVFVDEVLGPKKFRALVRVSLTKNIYVIIDNHSTKDYVDEQRVHINSFIEVTGTEKNEFGETLRVLTQLDISEDRIKKELGLK